jgi:hypothetical protein
MEQYKMQNGPSWIFAMEQLQFDLMETLALILTLNIPTRAEYFIGNNNEPADLYSSSITAKISTNLKMLLQVHF